MVDFEPQIKTLDHCHLHSCRLHEQSRTIRGCSKAKVSVVKVAIYEVNIGLGYAVSMCFRKPSANATFFDDEYCFHNF